MSRILLPKVSSIKSIQLRRVESLDWKRIASLDIEKIIEETDEETLRDILPQIAFCQPDVEFDHNRTDPGFRKVFRLGQLIIEHLIQSQEVALEKVTTMDTKYTQVLQKNRHQDEEIRRLRNRLLEAKKELKRRKDLIQSKQLESYGATRDEIDQCPYCDKKFVNTVYLYSHLQRRHQGLPAIRLPGQGKGGSAVVITPRPVEAQGVAKDVAEKSLAVNYVSTQTDEAELMSGMVTSKSFIDRQVVNDLVEEYLRQRVGPSSAGFPQSSEMQGNRSEGQWPLGEDHNGSRDSLKPISPRLADASQATIGDMKEALESQWRSLIEKMHKTELEELKTTLLEEMHKMQEIFAKSATKVSEASKSNQGLSPNVTATVTSPSVALVGRVEERIQKQENEFENLKLNLQTRIRADIGLIESRMESQERFWRAKLRTVENEYQDHIARLRQEFQASLHQQNVERLDHPKSPSLSHQVKTSPGKVKVNWPSDDAIMVNIKPPTPSNSEILTNDEQLASAEAETESSAPRPIPKPRPRPSQIQTLPRTTPVVAMSRKDDEPQRITGLPPKVPQEFRVEPKMKPMTLPTSHDFVDVKKRELPNELENLSDESESDDDTSSIGSYTPVKQKSAKTPPPSTPKLNVKDTITMTSTDVHTETDDLGLGQGVTAAKAPDAQAQGLQELSRQLQQLGIRPEATQVSRDVLKKTFTVMKTRRTSLNEEVDGFDAERELQKEQTNIQGHTKMLETKVNEMTHSHRLSSKPLRQPGTSPLSKMFRAVKNSGNSLKRKMSLVGHTVVGKPKVNVLSPRIRPKFNVTLNPGGGASSTPSSVKPASRKSGPPPPPPPAALQKTPLVPPAALQKSPIPAKPKPKKKKPKIGTFFRRSLLRKTSEDTDSASDVDIGVKPDSGAENILKRTRPTQFNNTPTPTHKGSPAKPIAAKRFSVDKGQPKVIVISDDGPDAESHEVQPKKVNEIQRRAAKEIELGKHGLTPRGKDSPIPGPSKKQGQISTGIEMHDGSSDSDDNFAPFQTNIYSSTANGEKNFEFEPSVSSLNDDDTSDSSSGDVSEIESEAVPPTNQKKSDDRDWNKENGGAESSKRMAQTTVRTIVHHDPMEGLNEFGLKINNKPPAKTRRSDSFTSSNSSITSIFGGTKKLKRLQHSDTKTSPNHIQRLSPSVMRELKQSPMFKNIKTDGKQGDALNKSSDWETSVQDAMTDLSNVKKPVKSPVKNAAPPPGTKIQPTASPVKKTPIPPRPTINSPQPKVKKIQTALEPKFDDKDYGWDSP